jgi:hypothetical protein
LGVDYLPYGGSVLLFESLEWQSLDSLDDLVQKWSEAEPFNAFSGALIVD